VTIEQRTPPTPGQSTKLPLHMPFKIGFLGAGGKPLGEKLIEVTKEKETFTFAGVPADAVISPLREFTAPVNLKWLASDLELETLIMNDSDAFNAWEAWQKYFTSEFGNLIKTQQIEASAQKLARVLLGALRGHQKDPAFAAEFLSLPSLIDLHKQFGASFSFDGIVMTRTELLRQMSTKLVKEMLEICLEASKLEPGAEAGEQRAYRALKNATLGFAAYSQKDEVLNLALSQVKSAKNMTDEISALQILNRHCGTHRDLANDLFYKKWQKEPLVVDSWLATKVTSTSEKLFEELETLYASEFGQTTNPNRNRAIYAAFAIYNPTLLHHRSGRGYAFLARRVLEMDKFNPQLAARVAGFFSDVQSMDAARKELAAKEFQKILAQKISDNLREIVEKF
jgi:aminopeptidase N